MAAQLIDGEKIAAGLKADLKAEVETLIKNGTIPHLKAVQVGGNPASRLYVKNQKKSCEEIGVAYTLDELPPDTIEEQLIEHIKKLNADKETTGIILQMPLPTGINAQKVQSLITPAKDVEGMNLVSMGAVVYGNARLAPCTAMAAVELIKSVGINLTGTEATIVGRSAIVGKPVSLMLLDLHVTPTICHTRTKDISFHTKRADILIAATGKPETIRGNMVKPGAIVIDVGINRVPELDERGNQILDAKGKPKMKTVGDVVFDEAKEVAGYITPVPGGVGPITVVMLLRNTIEATKMTKSSFSPL
ncbi:MAG TPA: bifunctional 5,10-methylenetetrahydrofolate dehydrogenase/5,10-methenyltetrahydrofolate cyclohydrolase [Candidatus Brocadiia bacterium]|nr:bifunctional 5,10-methylenetetrahydrofolate dehydrogenase/5,10-methenyltetrahydrofolate cyclohydrolase [Candidatus Brocadiales bacterium]